MRRDDEFYVGYQPRAPRGLGRSAMRVTFGLLLLGLGAALLLASRQRPPAPAVFEYGELRAFLGVVRERPYPMLLLRRPGIDLQTGVYLLAGQGKHGASAVAGQDGRSVQLAGTLIYRGHRTMVEIGDQVEFLPDPEPVSAPDETDLGPVTLQGEIVDSKCHLGAMNPGDGPTHRLCALRCLRGGLPPLLAVAGADPVILAGMDGGPLPADALQFVGIRVEVGGRLRLLGEWRVLRVDPASIRPVAGP